MSDLNTVGILGAGTMGAGIAQVAATAGWTVHLFDVNAEVVRAAIENIHRMLDRLVEKQRMTAEQCANAKQNILPAEKVAELKDCSLVIEAIVEDFDIKIKALQPIMDVVSDSTIIASNTSSLSITKLGEGLNCASRFVGMHFFNPAPLMKLVEVIAGKNTDPAVVNQVAAIADSWQKKVARAADVPGFIVNHVARPYYLEAFRILEDGYATPAQIDHAMKTLGGFRMGPLELTDLIGQDVNTATTRSVWEQLDKPPLLHPNAIQEQLVAEKNLGRKTKRGVYDYTGEEPAQALETKPRDLKLNDVLAKAVEDFVSAATENTSGNVVDQYIFARIIAALIVQAHMAEQRGVATAADIDIALKFGVNYPKGPFEWAAQIGEERVGALLEALNATVDDDRFAMPGNLLSAVKH